MRLSYLLALALFTIPSLAFSQIYNPVKWSFDTKHVKGDEFDLIIHAEIQDGWNIYAQEIDEGGPVPTSFNWDAGDHFEAIGKVKESDNAKTLHDNIFDMKVTKFFKYADFTQRVKVKDYSKAITGYMEFMTCDKERCLPPSDVDLDFKLEKTSNGAGSDMGDASTNEQIDIPQKEEKEVALKEVATGSSVAEVQEAIEDVNAQVANQIQERADEIAESAEADQQSGGFGSVNLGGADVESADQEAVPSGMEKRVEWSYDIKKVADNEYDLIWKAKIDEGWHIYSHFLEEADIRPIPTTFYLDTLDTYNLEGNLREASSKRVEGRDPLFDNMNVIKFKKDATFSQRIKVNDKGVIIHGELEYMTCDAEKCIMGSYPEFSFDIDQLKAGAGDWTVSANDKTASLTSANVIDNAIPSIQQTYVTPIGDCGEEDTTRDKGLLWTFILGFGGGLLALLTPCVFPMIPLTVSFFTKDTKRKGWVNGAIYGLSIMVIYVGLGLVITALFGADALNALSTSWIANTIFFLIFLFFAFSFFGYYEIQLPSSLANKSDSMADKGGLIGIFFMAFTLAIVSFSCTGPIIGSALVESATSKIGPAVVMFGFSLALALPFGLFAAFPAWLNTLPKSGGWMNSVKVMLGFAELALAFKFLSVADMTSHWGVLRYEPFMIIWVLVAIGMALYMFGLIKFPHDSPVKKLNATRWTLGLGCSVLALYLASGFLYNDKTKTYNSLGLMSGLAPPALYNFFLPEPSLDESIAARYPSFTKCANNLDCFKDYYEGLSYAQEINKPILLDFTGYGCVNCRKTEEHIWVRDNVWEKIDQDYVLISLYVDDKKSLDTVKLSPDGEKKFRTVGRIWADFQEVNFQQNSQPLYVLMTPEEKVLAKPRGYVNDVNGYAEFLNCGLQTFERSSSTLE